MIREIEEDLKDMKINLSPYDHVLLARHEKRPKVIDFINEIIDEPIFFKGD